MSSFLVDVLAFQKFKCPPDDGAEDSGLNRPNKAFEGVLAFC